MKNFLMTAVEVGGAEYYAKSCPMQSSTRTMSTKVKNIWDDDPSVKTGGWEIVSAEDWLLRPSVRKNITVRIFEALRRAAEAESLVPDTVDPKMEFNVRRASNAVYGFLFGIKTYEMMMEDNRLPKQSKDGRLVYELEYNVLRVREVPSLAHDAAGNALTGNLLAWSQNYNMMSPETLTVLGGGQWVYQIGSEKSPDQSYRPDNIQLNLGARLIPGTNLIYPTFVIEIAKSHESYPELLRDCDAKHFSPLTSVMIWLGVKVFPNGVMKAVFRLRDLVQGFGYDRNSGAETATIPINQPTPIEFVLPKNLIFFSVPPPLPPTPFRLPGPHCLPPPVNPNVLTDDYYAPLERIRTRLFQNWR